MTVPERVMEIGSASNEPVYVYDLAALRRSISAVEQIPWQNKHLFFATMANDHPAVLAELRDRGHGIFVNSPRHLRLGLDLGIPAERIVFAASNMTAGDMLLCRDARVHVVLDSLHELEAYARLAGSGESVGVRVNVGSALDGGTLRHDPNYRFGILPEELAEAVCSAARFGVRITGVHCYFGTDVMEWQTLVEGLDRLGEVAAALPDLQYLDGGGGLGIADRLDVPAFDLAAYGTGAATVLAAHERRLGRPLALFIEPGRYLAASCGWFFAKVVGCKQRTDRLFVGTNASVAQFPRPLLYPDKARHPWQIVGRETARAHDLPVWLCGNSTYSRDFLARAATAPLPEPGETLVFHNAGAYCRSMLTEFLGKSRPLEYVIDSDAAAALPADEPAAALLVP